VIFLWRVCAFLGNLRGVKKKTPQKAKTFWKKSMSKKNYKKNEGGTEALFLSAFLAVSLHDELKNTMQYFPNSDLQISKAF
jgi:hypothetical protein